MTDNIKLPKLPEPDICRYVVTVWRDGVECEIDKGPRYTVEQMQAYAREAVRLNAQAEQTDARDAARWRYIAWHIGVAWNEQGFTSLVRIVSDKHREMLGDMVDRMMAGDWPEAAPQPAQPAQPLAFSGVAKRKLDDLKAQGYNVVGYMLARAQADYTVQRGAIDTGGMVIWWNREPLLTVEMVDAAMVEMSNIHPPLKRSECERLLRAAMASRLVEWPPAVQHLPADDTEGGAA